MVYDDAAKIYADIKANGEKLRSSALQALQAHVTGSDGDTERATKKRKTEDAEMLLVVNTVDAPRVEVLEMPGAKSHPLQLSHNSQPLCINSLPFLSLILTILTRTLSLTDVISAPAIGYSITDLEEPLKINHPVSVTTASAEHVKKKRTSDAMEVERAKAREEEEEDGSLYVLENEFVRVQVLPDGHVVSVWDKKASREAIDESAAAFGNNFVVFDDVPLFWDAWDTMFYAQQKTHHTYLTTSMEVSIFFPPTLSDHLF